VRMARTDQVPGAAVVERVEAILATAPAQLEAGEVVPRPRVGGVATHRLTLGGDRATLGRAASPQTAAAAHAAASRARHATASATSPGTIAGRSSATFGDQK